MNRRQLLSSAGASLGALAAVNANALATLRLQTEHPSQGADKPVFDIDDHSLAASMYLGGLFTWLELLEDTLDALYDAIDEMTDDPESLRAKASMLMPLGVWMYLAADTQKFNPPEVFHLAHEHAADAFSELNNAADIIATGVISGSATAITLGTEHINLAAEHIGLLISELLFERPHRVEVLG